MIKPLFNFLNAEDKLTIRNRRRTLYKTFKQNLHYPEVQKEADAEVISVRLVHFLLDISPLVWKKEEKTQIGFGLISKMRLLNNFF